MAASRLREMMEDKEAREGLVEGRIEASLPAQILALRRKAGLSQAQLAERLGTSQSVVARYEVPGYSNFTLKTLKKLSHIFDVALIVKFAPFSELIEREGKLSEKDLAVVSYHDEKAAQGQDTNEHNPEQEREKILSNAES